MSFNLAHGLCAVNVKLNCRTEDGHRNHNRHLSCLDLSYYKMRHYIYIFYMVNLSANMFVLMDINIICLCLKTVN